jgi:hypothetical protein
MIRDTDPEDENDGEDQPESGTGETALPDTSRLSHNPIRGSSPESGG